MNLHEQISRTKTLMGIQPLNEGIFRKKGKLKDLIKNLFNKRGNNEQIVQEISPYIVKYGKQSNSFYVDGVNLMITSNEQLSNSEAKSEMIFCTIFIITDTPQPLPDDASKNSTNISYSITFQKTEGNTTTQFYEYFKSVFLVDGVVTDEMSQLRETGNKFTCSTSTLEKTKMSGEPLDTGCVLPEEVKEIVLNAFKDNESFFQVQSYLDKLK